MTRENFAKSIVQMAFQAIADLEPRSTTRIHFSDSQKETPIFKQDYQSFHDHFMKRIKEYVDQSQTVKSIVFYQAHHGVKGNASSVFGEIFAHVEKSKEKNIWFIQIHTAITVKAPKNSAILIDYSKLRSALSTVTLTETCNFNLNGYGHFYGASRSETFKFSYAQAYDPTFHLIKQKDLDCIIYLHHTLKGFNGINVNQNKTDPIALQKLEQYRAYLIYARGANGVAGGMDIRVEIVEDFQYFQFESAKYFPGHWDNGKRQRHVFITEILEVMNSLVQHRALVVMNNFSSYVDRHTKDALKILTKFFGSYYLKRTIPRENHESIYSSEQKLNAFIHGNKSRFNGTYLEKMASPRKFFFEYDKKPPTLTLEVFSTKKDSYQLFKGVNPDNTVDYLHFLYQTSDLKSMKVVMESVTSSEADTYTPKKLAERLLSLYVKAFFFIKNGTISRKELMIDTLSIERTLKHPVKVLVHADLFDVILHPQDEILKMINASLDIPSVNQAILQNALKTAFKEHVKFWPCSFTKSEIDKSKNTWLPVHELQQAIDLNILSEGHKYYLSCKGNAQRNLIPHIKQMKKHEQKRQPQPTTLRPTSSRNGLTSDEIIDYLQSGDETILAPKTTTINTIQNNISTGRTSGQHIQGKAVSFDLVTSIQIELNASTSQEPAIHNSVEKGVTFRKSQFEESLPDPEPTNAKLVTAFKVLGPAEILAPKTTTIKTGQNEELTGGTAGQYIQGRAVSFDVVNLIPMELNASTSEEPAIHSSAEIGMTPQKSQLEETTLDSEPVNAKLVTTSKVFEPAKDNAMRENNSKLSSMTYEQREASLKAASKNILKKKFQWQFIFESQSLQNLAQSTVKSFVTRSCKKMTKQEMTSNYNLTTSEAVKLKNMGSK